MKTKKSLGKVLISLLLTLTLVIGAAMPVNAATANEKITRSFSVTFDKIWDKVADFIVGTLVKGLLSADTFGLIVKSNSFPTLTEYTADQNAHEYFYEGTNGTVQGNGWKLGYDSVSIIPTAWRENANGEADPNGMCLNKDYYFGGYFGSKVNKIYDDERVNLAILSAGTDENRNGIEDIIIIASIDNIGVANGNVRDIRASVSKALQDKAGLAPDDIVSFQLSSTHAHTTIEALGMSLGPVFKTALSNHFLFRKGRAIEPELYDTIRNNTAAAAVKAYNNMESGSLYYYETPDVNEYLKANGINTEGTDTVRDKNEYGANCQKHFACWYFESVSGEKTVLANMGLHPTFTGRSSEKVCADVTYYMWLAMEEAGCNLVFIQGSQAAIGLRGNYTREGYNWAKSKTLSYEDWVQRYGKKYADQRFNANDKDSGEEEYFNQKATGYTLAHLILSSANKNNPTAPVINIKMAETLVPLNYGIIYLAAHTGCFGYNTVKYRCSESGYAIVTEIGYLQFGNDVAMLSLPGEVSPTLIFGTDPDYTGENAWQGAGSWTGETWEYPTVESIAKEKLGCKTVLAMGICNDEIGYVLPDTDVAQNFLTKTLLASMGEIRGRSANEELMSASPKAGSSLVNGFVELFK